MSIVCVCPQCGRNIRVDDALAGKRIRCPECASAVRVRSPDVPATSQAGSRPAARRDRDSASAPFEQNLEQNSTPFSGRDGHRSLAAIWKIGTAVVVVALLGVSLLFSRSEVTSLPSRDASPTGTQPPDFLLQSDGASGQTTKATGGAPQSAESQPRTTVDLRDLLAAGESATAPAEEPSRVAAPQDNAGDTPEASLPENRPDGINSTTPPQPPATIVSTRPTEPSVPSDDTTVDSSPTQSVAGSESAGGSVLPPQPVPVAETPASLAEAQAVAGILKNACYRCHGEGGTNEGGMNYVASLERVREFLVRPGDPEGSLLIRRIASTDSATLMPPAGEMPQLSPANVQTIRSWIANGAQVPSSQSQRTFITAEQVIQTIHADLMTLNERSRRFIRYFTLTHLYNAGVSEEEMQTYRLAFAKLVNSLSWGRQIVLPHEVNDSRTILRVDIRDLNWSSEIWEQILGVNPYPFEPDLPMADACAEQCGTPEPWVRADWFVFKASRPPLYHQVLRIPDTEKELELLLHVDAPANIEQEKIVRAGFNRSGVSRNNRLIERHEIAYGAYWKSYDFAANTGRQNLFEYPEGPVGDQAFQHDGGELIFTLPNGLQGYMLSDGSGARLDSGPTAIVSDPATHDRTVINGVSCFSCHFAGIIRKEDEIRPFLEINSDAFDNVGYLRAIYPGQSTLDGHYKSDGQAYLKTLSQLGITNTSRAGEPVSSMSQRFQAEIPTNMAAAEFGLTQAEFLKRMERLPGLPRALGILRVPGGTMKRDAFNEVFREASLLLSIDPDTAASTARIIAARTVVPRISFPQVRAAAMALSADGSRLVLATHTNALMLADTRTGEIIGTTVPLHDITSNTQISISPQGKQILVAGRDGQILIFDVTPAGEMKFADDYRGHLQDGGRAELKHLIISRDGTTVLSVSVDQHLHVWNLKTRKAQRVLQTPLKAEIRACWISTDGRDVSITDGRAVATFSSRNEKQPAIVSLGDKSPGAAVFSQNGKLVIVDGNRDGSLRFFETNSGREVAMIPMGRNAPLTGLLLADSGKTVVALGWGKLQAWQIADQSPTVISAPPEAGSRGTACSTGDNDLFAWVESEGFNTVVHFARLSPSNAAAFAATTAALSPGSRQTWKQGEKAEIRYGSGWSPVTILRMNPDRTVRIHWDGWSDTWDQDVQPTDLRPIALPRK
ncbi:MAG: hypothetical protein RLZZ232_919 [Planctomycetota bacterium]